MKSYIKFVDGTTEPILRWITPEGCRRNGCTVIAESGEYKFGIESYELERPISKVYSPLLIPDYVFYKLHRRWFASGIHEEWIRVNNIECFVEDRRDELSEVKA